MKVGIIGAGRIGKVHAKNISMFVPEMEIKTIADPFMNEQTEAFAKSCGIPNTTKDANDILNDPEIEAVLICSSTDTHSKYIIEAAHAGKHIFCEKPIDYDLEKVHAAINAAKEAGVKLQIGFCRRFDHNHRAVYDMVRDGKVGKVNIIKISSRDPEPPPVSYVKVSGGIMNTHSREADCRVELLVAAGLRAGVSRDNLMKILDSATTTEAIAYLEEEKKTKPVMDYLMERIIYYTNKRAGGKMKIECILYDNQYGELAKSEGAEEFLHELQHENVTANETTI